MKRTRPYETVRAMALATLALAAWTPAALADPQVPDAPPSTVNLPPPVRATQPGTTPTLPPTSAAPAAAVRDGLATPPTVIGTHQIDRYDAIKKLQESTKKSPKVVADWVILGELAHEVAMDAPADRAGEYFAMSRDAFEKARDLAPDNAAIKAAAQFAKDQMAGADAFEQSRDLATATFLEARRRDLAATNYTPYIRVWGSAQPDLTVRSRSGTAAPNTENAARTPGTSADDRTPREPLNAANFGTRIDFPQSAADAPTVIAGPTYQPLAAPGGTPYTYQQYNRSYFPPGVLSGNSAAAAPVTIQRANPTMITPNAYERSILNRAGGASTPVGVYPGARSGEIRTSPIPPTSGDAPRSK